MTCENKREKKSFTDFVNNNGEYDCANEEKKFKKNSDEFNFNEHAITCDQESNKSTDSNCMTNDDSALSSEVRLLYRHCNNIIASK